MGVPERLFIHRETCLFPDPISKCQRRGSRAEMLMCLGLGEGTGSEIGSREELTEQLIKG